MIPSKLQAGITAKWSQSIESELADYSFSYTLIGPVKITVPAAVNGNEITVSVAADETANWAAGDYHYQLIAEFGTDKQLVTSGQVSIAPDFTALAAGTDLRSHAEKMLSAIEQVLEGRITQDVEAYQIDGRQLTKIPIVELEKLRRTYARKVRKERLKAKGISSFNPRIVKTRFK